MKLRKRSRSSSMQEQNGPVNQITTGRYSDNGKAACTRSRTSRMTSCSASLWPASRRAKYLKTPSAHSTPPQLRCSWLPRSPLQAPCSTTQLLSYQQPPQEQEASETTPPTRRKTSCSTTFSASTWCNTRSLTTTSTRRSPTSKATPS